MSPPILSYSALVLICNQEVAYMKPTSPDRIERQIDINASPARVWRALTDYQELGEWFRVKLLSPFVVGQSTRGNITYPGYEYLVMDVRVAAMETEKRF